MADIELKAKEYDRLMKEKEKIEKYLQQTDMKEKEDDKEEEEIVEEFIKPKPKKKIIRRIIEESEDETDEEVIEEVIVKKPKAKSRPHIITNEDRMKLVHETAHEKLRHQLKEDRLNYLMTQLGIRL